MTRLPIFFLLLAASTAVDFPNYNVIRMLKPHSGPDPDIDCLSWRLGVETNNIQDWILNPAPCGEYVANYMIGRQYRSDCRIVANEAYEYAKGINVSKDGKDIWIFDVDETVLSNMPFIASAGIGSPINMTALYAWWAKGVAPVVPGSLRLYQRLVKLGFKIVFLTAADEFLREPRTKNLRAVGYTTWEKLILKQDGEGGSSDTFKSRKRNELVRAGYRIRGNMGDQWSDLLGSSIGDRRFKVPNPLYYNA